jgi:hypothetical protein
MWAKSHVKALVVGLCMITFSRAGTLQDKPAGQVIPEARPADVASIDAVVAAVYDVISGPAGQKRDWDRMRSLFIPGARLIPVSRSGGESAARVLSVEDYITRSSAILEERGFFEREIARRREEFGHIAHVFSTYESRRDARDKAPFSRGINSFQLLNDGRRWWIVTVFWEAEGPDVAIPPEYLK